MSYDELSSTIEALTQKGKGILAADESDGTIGKRFSTIKVENTEENRRDYRLLLATTKDLENYISGVILSEGTFKQKNDSGTPITELFAKKGIIPGIKVDKGLVALPGTENEQITQGLDGLEERLQQFKSLGARFAKWRNVYSINEFNPSLMAVKAGSEVLARYASSCQELGIVPIVEPEILMDGDHDIDLCADVAEIVLHELFSALFTHGVDLSHIILKPSMVTAGKDTKPFSIPEEIAEYTLSVFRSHVPAAVPTINFLSGGQTPHEAAINLNAINKLMPNQPWLLSFSYGRALQEDCLKAWSGKSANVSQAQEILIKQAQACSLASEGKFKE